MTEVIQWQGNLVILTGPSGGGKDTILQQIQQEYKRQGRNCRRVVTHASREIRPGEEDGIDYHFVSVAKFKNMIEAGEFVEWEPYRGPNDLKGTTRNELQGREGEIVIWRIDPVGASTVITGRNSRGEIFPVGDLNRFRERTKVIYVGIDDIWALEKRVKNRDPHKWDQQSYRKTLLRDIKVWREKQSLFEQYANIIINKWGQLDVTVQNVMETIDDPNKTIHALGLRGIATLGLKV